MENEFFKASMIGIVIKKARDSPWLMTIPVSQVIPCRVALQQSSTPLHLTDKYTIKCVNKCQDLFFLLNLLNKCIKLVLK